MFLSFFFSNIYSSPLDNECTHYKAFYCHQNCSINTESYEYISIFADNEEIFATLNIDNLKGLMAENVSIIPSTNNLNLSFETLNLFNSPIVQKNATIYAENARTDYMSLFFIDYLYSKYGEIRDSQNRVLLLT